MTTPHADIATHPQYLALVQTLTDCDPDEADFARAQLHDWLMDHNAWTRRETLRLVHYFPDATGPRLLYADWERECGDAARAVFVGNMLNPYWSQQNIETGPPWLKWVSPVIEKFRLRRDVEHLARTRKLTAIWSRGFIHSLSIPTDKIHLLPFIVPYHPISTISVGDHEWIKEYAGHGGRSGWAFDLAALPDRVQEFVREGGHPPGDIDLVRGVTMTVLPHIDTVIERSSRLFLAWAKHAAARSRPSFIDAIAD